MLKLRKNAIFLLIVLMCFTSCTMSQSPLKKNSDFNVFELSTAAWGQNPEGLIDIIGDKNVTNGAGTIIYTVEDGELGSCKGTIEYHFMKPIINDNYCLYLVKFTTKISEDEAANLWSELCTAVDTMEVPMNEATPRYYASSLSTMDLPLNMRDEINKNVSDYMVAHPEIDFTFPIGTDITRSTSTTLVTMQYDFNSNGDATFIFDGKGVASAIAHTGM